MKNFEGFTNLYELNKTLRFELKPISRTEELLQENHIIELDKNRRDAYEKVKPYFDNLHLDFVNISLDNPNMERDFEEYFEIYKKYLKDKKNKAAEKEKIEIEKALMKKLEKFFDSGAKEYLRYFSEIKFKKENKDFLYEIEIFELLKKRFESDVRTHITNPETGEITTIFDGWNRWLCYFTKFFNTRKNFYKSDGTSTAISTRIINDNLKIFCDNILIFEKIKDKLDFSELKKDFSMDFLEIFTLNFYNTCFLQRGIDLYNFTIGGKTLEEELVLKNGKKFKAGIKLKGINEYINEYRQKTGEKLPFLKKLQKQILSERKESFIHQIENENEFEIILRKFFEHSNEKVGYLKNIFGSLKNYTDEQYRKIYFNKIALNTLSHKFFADVLEFEKNLFETLKVDKNFAGKYTKKENKYSFPDFISLYFIKNALENYKGEEKIWKERYYTGEENEKGIIKFGSKNFWKDFCDILNFEFKNILEKEIINENGEKITTGYSIYKEKLAEILKKEKFSLQEKEKIIIKDFADSSRILYNFGKYFALEKGRNWNENLDLEDSFYEGENGYKENFYENAYEEIIVSYNLMRNFIAKKPWSDAKKWKLNFENSSLLSGWDKNFESNGSYIFKKGNKFYLGVINGTKPGGEFLENLKTSGKNTIKRFIYDFQKPDNKNIPRTFIRSKGDSFAPAVEKYNLPVEEIIDIYDKGLFKTENKNNSDFKKSLKKMIDYFKLGLSKHDSYKHYNFIWKNSDEYENIADFYRDAEKSCYKPSWEVLNYDELLKLVENKKMYLFQIYNKDFELDESLQDEDYICKISGSKNVHTLYFESLFNSENIENPNGVVMKLSGGGEVFFRPKVSEEKLGKKKDNKGKELINHKRYVENKMFLHFPMQLNFKENISGNFNEKINKFLANNPDINIIGVDRGEKHLAYFSVINQKSEILESGSLNYTENFDKEGNLILKPEKKIIEIKDNKGNIVDYELQETGKMVKYTDYALLLELKEKKRKLQRQSWKEVEQIKDLKKGYISAVVKKLADLVIKYNAIIVFEDLNMRFKQIRGGIERSVYQQLEKALIDKLNFLVEKNEINPKKAGNLLKAYQLTAPIETFKDIEKQTGIIFYTQASYTSKIDPITGWRPNLYLKKQNAEKNKENILKLDEIIFNSEKNRFEISYDLKKFIKPENAKFPSKTKWTVCSSVERFRWNKYLANNKGDYDHYENLTDGKLINREIKDGEIVNLKQLFYKYNIDILGNILEQIKKLETSGNEKFFSDFIFFFTLICQIRNTDEKAVGNENDFILSPVEPFFDSRNSEEFGKNLPKSGDDNGAYNIARKGVIILERISEWSKQDKEIYPDLFVSNKDWDEFVSGI